MTWSDELKAFTRDTLHDMPVTPDGLIALKHADGRFGTIALDDLMAGRFVVTDRSSGALSSFDDAEALIGDGWAVD